MAPTILCWSGGKDCAASLWRMRQAGQEVRALLCTFDEDGCSAMHRVPADAIRAQAEALRLPLVEMGLPRWPSNELYRERLAAALSAPDLVGVTTLAFGDLFLEDVRAFREELCRSLNVTASFPVWGESTAELVREIIATGFRAVVVAVDPRRVDPGLLGQELTLEILDCLSPDVDPCGENGEFHTFVTDGPSFANRVNVGVSETYEDDGFAFVRLEAQAASSMP